MIFGGVHSGGDDGIRTHDPLLAGQVLSQLSYTPVLGESLVSFPGSLRDPGKASAPTYFPVLLPAKYLRLSGA